MLIRPELCLSLRCPYCTQENFFALNRFRLKDGFNTTLRCSGCGTPVAAVEVRDSGVIFQVYCLICGGKHVFYYKSKQVWERGVKYFTCPETGLEPGVLGRREEVMAVAEANRRLYEELVENAEELADFGEIFNNPGVMAEAIGHLRQLVDAGKLYCECGCGDLEVNLFPDHIKLSCPLCGGVLIVKAETESELNRLKKARSIRLRAGEKRIFGVRSRRKRAPSSGSTEKGNN